MLPLERPERIQITFDDHRLVANAGLLLPATLALRLGLGELVDRFLDLGDAPGRANTGDKLMTLVVSALAGGDCIDGADALRGGGTFSVLACTVKSPSTLGAFLQGKASQPHLPGFILPKFRRKACVPAVSIPGRPTGPPAVLHSGSRALSRRTR